MATVPAEQDHTRLKEIGAFVVDMGEQYDEGAMAYAVALYLYYTENGPKPKHPDMHGFMAKAIREVVLDVVMMDRRVKGKAA